MEFSIGQIMFKVGLAQSKDGKKTLSATIQIPVGNDKRIDVEIFYQESAKTGSIKVTQEEVSHAQESIK